MNLIDQLKAKGLHVECKLAPSWRFWDKRCSLKLTDPTNPGNEFSIKASELLVFELVSCAATVPREEVFELLYKFSVELGRKQAQKSFEK